MVDREVKVRQMVFLFDSMRFDDKRSHAIQFKTQYLPKEKTIVTTIVQIDVLKPKRCEQTEVSNLVCLINKKNQFCNWAFNKQIELTTTITI